MTLFIIMKNNSLECQQCLDQIRSISSDGMFRNVVVLDAASTSEHADVIGQYKDITYIRFSVDEAVFSNMINMSVEALQIEEDFFIIDSCILMSCDFHSILQKKMDTEEKIGTIVPLYDSMLYSYISETYDRYVLGSSYAAVYIPYSSWKAVGGFDSNIQNASCALYDFQLRLLEMGYKNIISCDMKFGKISNHFSFQEQYFPVGSDYDYMEEKWGMRYFNARPNADLVQMIDSVYDADIKVLEIGCDCGATLLDIKSKYKNASIFGMELNEPAAKIASKFAEIQIGNIETDELIWNEQFDVIIFGDVLEHLHNPEAVLVKCQKYLKNEGCIISSIPNVQHISVVYPLLHGRFEYTEIGLLDKTHIHLFTGVEIHLLFQKAGYTIDVTNAVTSRLSTEQEQAIDKLKSIFPDISENLFKVFQYQIRAKKKRE